MINISYALKSNGGHKISITEADSFNKGQTSLKNIIFDSFIGNYCYFITFSDIPDNNDIQKFLNKVKENKYCNVYYTDIEYPITDFTRDLVSNEIKIEKFKREKVEKPHSGIYFYNDIFINDIHVYNTMIEIVKSASNDDLRIIIIPNISNKDILYDMMNFFHIDDKFNSYIRFIDFEHIDF